MTMIVSLNTEMADFDTVQDMAYNLAEGRAQYSTAKLSIFETE